MATWPETTRRIAHILGTTRPHAQAQAEAWRLCASIAGRSMASLFPSGIGMPVSADELALIEPAIVRLRSGEPEAYVMGRVPFHDVEVDVDGRALVPRQETELLVEAVVEWCRQASIQAPRILDLGTGTGCIALALAAALPRARIIATDICIRALSLAARNLRRRPTGAWVGLVCADWLSWTNSAWDVIVTNPPYIPVAAIGELPPSVRDWEPGQALDGGIDGFVHIGTLIAHAPRHLLSRGLLALELSPEHAGRAHATALASGFADAAILPDYAGRSRVLLATLGGSCCGV
jgi:release factor glutamine methyltransferase